MSTVAIQHDYRINNARVPAESTRRKTGSRLLRTLRLLEFLQSGRGCNSAELADICGVSRRTVFRDIATLQEAGVGVMYDESRGGYYLPHRLALAPSELTFAESVALLVACRGAGALGVSSETAAAKVCTHLPKSLRDAARAVADNVVVQTKGLENPGDARRFLTCLDALHRRRRVRFIDGDSSVIDTVDTYRLLYAENAWRLIGKSLLHREVRCYALKKMRNLTVLDETYLIPLRFSLDRFLGNAWRIVRELPARQIVIVFDADCAEDFDATCWHQTQTTRRLADGRLEFRAEVEGLDEIVSWILKFGPRAEVLEPPELRARISETIEMMRGKYLPAANSG